MRRRSSALTAPSVRTQLPSSTRERSDGALGAHRDLDVGRVGQPRDQPGLQRARELGPQVRRQPHQLDRHRRQQVRDPRAPSWRAISSMMSSTSSKKSMLSLRALDQLFDLAGRRRRAGGCAGGSTCTRPAAPGLDAASTIVGSLGRRPGAADRPPAGSAGAAPRVSMRCGTCRRGRLLARGVRRVPG